MLVMATMMIPGEATIISNYLTVSSWNWLDSYQVLIVPYLTSAMGIFLFRQFYLTFPISLYESAKIDGCSNLRFIWQILMPLTKSAMGAMAVYQRMEYVHVAVACNWFRQDAYRTDRYRNAGQRGFSVHHPDDRRCCTDHPAIHFHLHRRPEAADPRHVLRRCKRLING